MRKKSRAQGMTEYIIIVGLIAIVLIFAVFRYGDTLRQIIEGSENKARTTVGNSLGGLPEMNTGDD